MAAVAIWRINSDVTNTLPVLVEGITQGDDNTDSKWELIEALGEMGSRAKDAFPALMQLLQQKPGVDEWNLARSEMLCSKSIPELLPKPE